MPKWFVLACISALVAASAAPAADMQTFWDSRCSECHGSAGAFAREHLGVEAGALVGRKRPVDLKQFLSQHEAGAAAAEDVYRMLLAHVQAEPLYDQRCARCHETAAEFARSSLVVKDGAVSGKSNQQPITTFLLKHGKLSADEIPVIIDSLTRALKSAGSAPAK